ncbi:MAG: heavy-metal-associated domain-containing protein [Acidobacteria bacterium]|nr:heavy-metal-associated domain-containing protein [Acidobacteriota bacterium]
MRYVILLAALSSLRAEFLRIEMGFGGIDCASCAQFIEGKFSRNSGVNSVQVDRKKGVVILDLKPGNNVRYTQVRDFIQQSGFTPKDAKVKVRGTPQPDGLRIAETGLVLSLRDPANRLREYQNQRVEIEGVLTRSGSNGVTADVLEVAKADLVQ